MKGVINEQFKSVFLDEVEGVYFVEGDEIEILKIINDESFKSNIGYVIFNHRNHESITLDSSYIDLIK